MSEPNPNEPKVLDAGHDYDGIEEYDNKLPNWWLMTLHGAIIFSIGYWMYFHQFDVGPSSMEAFQAEMDAAKAESDARLAKMGGLSDETLTKLAGDAEAVKRGKEAFATTCLACHGANGEGTVGPNLTDAYWVNGHRPVDIHKVIAVGQLDKGMPAWEPVLGAAKVRDVTAYVLTLGGKNLPGKPAQGVTADGTPAPAGGAAPAPTPPPPPADAPAAPDTPPAAPTDGAG
jgi:cytochrome c oxidase cbb3-type subunit 3